MGDHKYKSIQIKSIAINFKNILLFGVILPNVIIQAKQIVNL